MIQIKRYVIFLLAVMAPFLVQAKPLNVVATTGIIGDLVHNIGQDRVELISLMGSGVDPHLYRATQGDLRRLQNADIIFYNGFFLEGQMQDIFEKMAATKPVYAVLQDIPRNELIALEGAEPGSIYTHDPHAWFDVRLWIQAGELVLKKLSAHDPKNSDFFNKNAQAHFAELESLHVWAKKQISQIPESQRVLVTAHDAFGYFGRAYDMEVAALQGLSTASEFGLHDIKELKDFIVERGVAAVFVEASVPKRFLESLVAGVNAEGKDLKIGGELFSDAMGLKDTPEGTYIGMIKYNVNTIVGALK